MDYLEIIKTFSPIAISIFALWYSINRSRIQNKLDDTTTSKHALEIAEKAVAEAYSSKTRIEELEKEVLLLKNNSLKIILEVIPNEKPDIIDWSWNPVTKTN